MFWILHLIALLFFLPALFITIPLHLINNGIKMSAFKKELINEIKELKKENNKSEDEKDVVKRCEEKNIKIEKTETRIPWTEREEAYKPWAEREEDI